MSTAATALRRQLAESMRRAFAPKSRLTVSEWVDQHGWIARSSGAAESGPYSTARAPYLREILDVMGDERHPDVVFNKPAQVGFTEAINQFVGYCMAEDPSLVLVIRPDIGDAKSWMKERIDPMIAESPRLKGIIRSEGRRLTSDDTMQRKVFPGGALVALGANSGNGLRGRPSRRVIGDERSGWTLDARNQGDPWDLAGERTSTFWNAKRIQGSTPGEEGTCPITATLAESDLRRFHVTCPACGFVEPFTWKAPDGTYRLVFDRDPANQIIPETARYLCMECGVAIPETEKPRMNRGGRWVPTYPGREIVGFDMNGLLSPWRTWAKVGAMWRDTQGGDLSKLKVFVTHVLAEPWRAPGERIDVQALRDRATEPARAPEDAALCTGYIDVQSNRVESLVVAWAAGEESFTLDWRQHDGDPTRPEAWHDAYAHLTTTDYGAPLRVIGVDTGYLTDEVWRWVDRWHRRGGIQVHGCKGVAGRGRPVAQKPGTSKRKGQRPPWLIGVDTAKDMLQLRLRQPVPPGGAGTCHFAESLDPVFFDQLTSEEVRTKLVGGRPQKVWTLMPGRRNEALDLWVGCLAMLYALGPRTIAQLGAIAQQRSATPRESAPDPEESTSFRALQRPAAPRRGGWVGGWR